MDGFYRGQFTVDDNVLGVIYATLDKNELKQISLVDKWLRGISLPLLLQRACNQFVYKENAWRLAADAIHSMLLSAVLDVISRETR
ncbi:hypothetical protein IW261DRAFT_1571237 [Armillaria novae-zelandiae]|uniref:Uncharacterized protein n=1 Tax=Armillaria novae-zelandiae TaxID=153914 RepID=A0AA39UAW4_9AGAR|nr:hypothetical protein IW261DRAFT_1571237 [Armillaria novae-zelandiae]